MLEKPKRKKVDKQDDSRPTNIEQLIEKYDLENIWSYIDKITDSTNGNDSSISNLQKTLETTIKNAILENDKNKYPIGKIEINISGANPATYLGFGTWVSWGSGRVPVGVNTSDSNFNTVEKIGGETTHTLTIDEIPSHNHLISKEEGVFWSPSSGGTWSLNSGNGVQRDNFNTQATGGGQSHNNLQPYITCYMWKRIS